MRLLIAFLAAQSRAVTPPRHKLCALPLGRSLMCPLTRSLRVATRAIPKRSLFRFCRVHDRAIVWLGRHGYLDERPVEERGDETDEKTPLDALAEIALSGGRYEARPFRV